VVATTRPAYLGGLSATTRLRMVMAGFIPAFFFTGIKLGRGRAIGVLIDAHPRLILSSKF
jgi:hypothetical protein